MRRFNWKGIMLLIAASIAMIALTIFLGYLLIFTGPGSI